MKIGGLLHIVVSPILLVLFYFGAVLPIGLCCGYRVRTCCASNAATRPIGSSGNRRDLSPKP